MRKKISLHEWATLIFPKNEENASKKFKLQFKFNRNLESSKVNQKTSFNFYDPFFASKFYDF